MASTCQAFFEIFSSLCVSHSDRLILQKFSKGFQTLNQGKQRGKKNTLMSPGETHPTDRSWEAEHENGEIEMKWF